MASSYSAEKVFLKTFTRGTYYKGAYAPCNGGSGRQLIDCAYGGESVKGSVASSFIYQNYGYNYNGKRTMVYLEVEQYPDMNGCYYVDDCNTFGVWDVVDFYYSDYGNVPPGFRNQGIITVDCYLVNY